MRPAVLLRLVALAQLRADRSANRLSRLQAAIDGLEGKADALRTPVEGAPASIADAIMRDRWDRWRSEQIRDINARIVRLEVVAEPLREAKARDTARARVLGTLAAKAT